MSARRLRPWLVLLAALLLSVTVAAPSQAARPVRASVTIATPTNGATLTSQYVGFSGTATGPVTQVQVRVDGDVVDYRDVGTDGRWATTVELAFGGHRLCAELDSGGTTPLASACVDVTVVPDPARFTLDRPSAGETPYTTFVASGSCQDGTEVTASLDGGATQTTPCYGSWAVQFRTTPGQHTVTASETSQGTTVATRSVSFTVVAAPELVLTITAPGDGSSGSESGVRVDGTVTNAWSAEVTLTVNGESAPVYEVSDDGTWYGYAPLRYGANRICATATDYYGATSTTCVDRTYAIDPATLTLTSPEQGSTWGMSIHYEGECFVGTDLRIELDGVVQANDTCYYRINGDIYYPSEGPHTLTVTMVKDGVDIASVSRDVVVDTIAPAPPTVTDPANGSTIRKVPVTVTGTANTDARVELVNADGSVDRTATVAANGTWSVVLDRAWFEARGLLTGKAQTVRLRFESVDAAGNRSAPTFVNWTVRAR